MDTARFPASWKKLTIGLLLALLLLCWLASFVRECVIVARLRTRGAEIRYNCGHAAHVSFPEDSDFADSDMDLLVKLRNLQSIELTGTRVTSSGLKSLRNLRNPEQLGFLSVLVKQITEQQEQELKAMFPYLEIERLWLVEGRQVVDGYQ